MPTEISEGGRLIEITRIDRSEDAAGRPMVGRDTISAELLDHMDGAQSVFVKVAAGYDAETISLTVEQGAELRDWLTSLNLNSNFNS